MLDAALAAVPVWLELTTAVPPVAVVVTPLAAPCPVVATSPTVSPLSQPRPHISATKMIAAQLDDERARAGRRVRRISGMAAAI